MYTWMPWTATMTAPANGSMQIVCRALDSQHNRQPENLETVWNVRGLLNNAYHRVNVSVRSGN
jgi:sulfite oxidase